MQAYSSETGKHYDSWDELVAAESNGWLTIALISSPKETWPYVTGPYDTKEQARNAQSRIRNKIKKEQRDHPDYGFSVYVRPAWKDPR